MIGTLKLSAAPSQYDRGDQATMRGALERADQQNHKRGQDIEVGNGCRLIFTDTATKARYALTVASGVLTLTAL